MTGRNENRLEALRSQLREAGEEALAERAVARGFLSSERLREALSRHSAGNAGLIDWLLGKGWITGEQVARLKSAAPSRPSESAARDTRLLPGLLALQMGLLSSRQLVECVEGWLKAPEGALREFAGLTPESLEMLEAAVQAQGSLDPAIESGVREDLLRLDLPRGVRDWLQSLSLRRAATSDFRPRPREERYELGEELSRGAIGRVVAAQDRHLKRDVAIKLVMDDVNPEVARRFVREAELAAKLDHPHIVPVYDFDAMPGPDGRPRLFLCMKRVRGRDLGEVIRSIAQGGAADGERFSRARMLRIFQDICLGIAFAHSRGVVHRDLKPSNVMIGEFGETLIVDWGLAKQAGDADGEPVQKGEAAAAGDPGLTMEGDVMGTPAYMSPEQASGRRAEVDHRSDVFALGGILYAILTHRPPFEGTSRADVLEQVRAGRVEAPSSRVRRLAVDPPRRRAADREAGASRADTREEIPPELDAICLKALAFRKEDRYPSARDLHDDVQQFLEGLKERERKHRLAEEAVARAKAAMAEQVRLKREAAAADRDRARTAAEVKPYEGKSKLWALEDRVRSLEIESVRAFADANSEIAIALGHEAGHAEARLLRAQLAWGKFLEAEEGRGEGEMLLHRRTVEQYNDGAFDALLKGDGTLTLRTRAYSCRCLESGRLVPPEDLVHHGYHPFSGRRLDRPSAGGHGQPHEPANPVRLKVHGKECVAEPVTGAHVWVWRYEDVDRLRIPLTPTGATAGPAVAASLDRLFGRESPYRPRGPGQYLGRTPVASRALPMGSWLLVLSLEGHEPVRLPVTIPRCGSLEQSVTLFRPGEVPGGFVHVPAGEFCYQGDSENRESAPPQSVDLDDFFVSRLPVTCREYAEFLNALEAARPGDAAAHVPRESQSSGFCWAGPPFAVPTKEWLASAPQELRTRVRRLQNCNEDWQEHWPVLGVSWEDAIAFAAWKRSVDAGAWTLLHECEWEKAARGTDRRRFPFGNSFDARWCNTNLSHAGGARPAGVEEFPEDESPYGVRGLGGNSKDLCMNIAGPDHFSWRVLRGGSWNSSSEVCRSASRSGSSASNVYLSFGLRLARLVRLPGPLPRLPAEISTG